ncbi:hypothetical protein [Aquihabitans sp. McL0605]|uniref:hypothetical protein n=1 Tax=Aquihabitans sp. McL0605 TaxID=3415671 RepID=UPI003CEEC2EB
MPASTAAAADRRPWRAAAIVTGLAALWILLSWATVPAGQQMGTWTTVFSTQQSRAEVLVAQMDGQAFAQQATDPSLAHLTAGYSGDQHQAAYRAARPVQGWVDWVASLGGQRSLLAPMILVLTVIGIGLLPLATGAVARALGRELRWGELVILTPAAIACLRWPGLCEPLAVVVAFAGLAAWLRGRHSLGIVLFCVAALTRETTLLIPLGLALTTMAQTRRLRPALPFGIPALAYVLWAGVVRLRIGAFPTGSAQMGLPFVGLVRTVPHWQLPELITFVLLVAACVELWRSRDAVLRGILVAHVAFVSCLGPLVWWYWWGFGRVTLPLFLLALTRPASHPADDDDAGVIAGADVAADASVPATA